MAMAAGEMAVERRAAREVAGATGAEAATARAEAATAWVGKADRKSVV
jgi:hypothetical protein